jgi:hypothetical protein
MFKDEIEKKIVKKWQQNKNPTKTLTLIMKLK